MHHSSKEFSEEERQRLVELMRQQGQELQLGATGEFPEGKLVGHDEGEISFGVTNHKGKVIINFNTSVHWLGMDSAQARLLARSLMSHATQVEKKRKKRRR